MSAEKIGDALARVHRDVAPTMGAICTTLEKRRVRHDTIKEWAASLRRAADELTMISRRLEGL